MAQEVEKNSYIFSFKKLPKAAVLAAVVIILLECSSKFLLQAVENNCRGRGYLLKLDQDFFCSNLKKYSEIHTLNDKYPVVRYRSWKDMGKYAPYDVIIFGTSVGNMGWVEMLRRDYGIKICNTTTEFYEYLPDPFARIMNRYKEINKHKKALLLYVDLSERYGYDFKNIGNMKNNSDPVIENNNRRYVTPFAKLIEYSKNKMQIIKQPMVKILSLGAKEHLFNQSDFEALSMVIKYDKDEYARLVQGLKYYKDMAAKDGCRLAIIIFPTKAQQYEWLLLQKKEVNHISARTNLNVLKMAAEENSIPFLDIEMHLDAIARKYIQEGKALWYRDDTHMNELGAYYTAKIVNKFIHEIDMQ